MVYSIFDIDVPVYIVLLASFVLLVIASWCVGEGGEILGKKYDASVIGGVVIAWLNTAPETIFFVTALQSNNPRFAVGAVSGSSIVVCTIALGACLWIGASARKSGQVSLQPAVKKQCAILGASILVTALIAVTGFSMLCGMLGVGYYLFFMFYSFKHKHEEEQLEDKRDEEAGDIEETEEPPNVSKGVAFLVCGGTMILCFSSPFINSVVEIASLWKVNPILLAFFLAPIASEAPEILESISLSRKGNAQSINIAYSNLVGGTVTKTTLLVGIFCFFGISKGFVWEYPSYPLSLALLSICAGSAAGIGAFFNVQSKWHGAALFALFLFTATIQYTTNTHFDDEIFPDESWAHNDNHSMTFSTLQASGLS